jgi:broad specificity phosphatase PhoE
MPVEGRQGDRNAARPLPTLDEVGAVTVLTALRNGGHILACRHAITDRSGNRRGPVSLNDRSTQRNLSAEGEEQARRLGRAVEALDVPIGDVYSSPWARTLESAQISFGRATRDDMLHGQHSARELRERFNRSPQEGNTVLMTHQGLLRMGLGYRQPGEGDCIVVRPSEDGPNVIVNVTVPEWEMMARARNGR